MDTGRPKHSAAVSAACACFCMRVAVPTASMQEINLPLNPEACRETEGLGELDDSEQSSHQTGRQAQRQMEWHAQRKTHKQTWALIWAISNCSFTHMGKFRDIHRGDLWWQSFLNFLSLRGLKYVSSVSSPSFYSLFCLPLGLTQHLVTGGGAQKTLHLLWFWKGEFPELGLTPPPLWRDTPSFSHTQNLLMHAQTKLGSGFIQKGCEDLNNQ